MVGPGTFTFPLHSKLAPNCQRRALLPSLLTPTTLLTPFTNLPTPTTDSLPSHRTPAPPPHLNCLRRTWPARPPSSQVTANRSQGAIGSIYGLYRHCPVHRTAEDGLQQELCVGKGEETGAGGFPSTELDRLSAGYSLVHIDRPLDPFPSDCDPYSTFCLPIKGAYVALLLSFSSPHL